MSADTAGAVLVFNAGSSSLKYQLVQPDTGVVIADGIAERIGDAGSSITHEQNGGETVTESVSLPDHLTAVRRAERFFADNGTDLVHADLAAVGHRVVHGGRSFYEPTLVDSWVISEIKRISPPWRRCTIRPTWWASRRPAPCFPTCRRSRCSTPPSSTDCPPRQRPTPSIGRWRPNTPSVGTDSTAPATSTCRAAWPSFSGRT